MWHPITGVQCVFSNTEGVVKYFMEALSRTNPLDAVAA
jgi:hypothetical protein